MKQLILWAVLLCAACFASCEDEKEILVIEVSKLTLNTETASLKVGEKIQMVSAFAPANATDTVVVWTSKEPDIAAVDGKGVITGLKAGTTVVSGKVGNGYAEVTVTVTAGKFGTEGLLLSKEELTLVEREQFNMSYEVYPGLEVTKDEVVWSSSDESVVTVADGIVTAVHAGKADIQLKVGELEAVCHVSVFERFVPATAIVFELEMIEVKVNESVEVKVKIEPEDATERNVSWSIDNSDYAEVHEGTVTGIYGGEAKLTARINDSIWCEVPVKIIQPVESIRFYDTYKEIGEGGTFTLRPTIEPYNATDQTVVWSTSDEKVATVVEENGVGVVKALTAGTAVIKATCGDKEATCEVVVSEDKGTPLEIPDANFLGALLMDYDANGNGRITDDEAEKVADLDLWWEDIASLQGIEYFKYLRVLDARHNALTTVDLSKNSDLEELKLGQNPLTTLDLKANTKLLLLDIEECVKIQSIDLSGNKQLASFSASNSSAFEIGDISHLVNLSSLTINGTATPSLNVTSNLKLKTLYCGGNPNFTLTGLEMLTELTDFYLYEASALEVIDLSNAKKLADVQLQGTHPKLTKVILPKGFNEANLYCSVKDAAGEEIKPVVEYK